MNHKSLISITACCILAAVGGLTAQSFAGSESNTNAQAERHLEKANELRKVADHDGAIGEYEKVISLSPNTDIAINAQYWIGQSHFQAGRLDAALAAFQTLLDKHPKSKVVASTKQMIERVEQSKEEKALFEAVKNGDLGQLKSLISKGADVNAKVKGMTLLNLAIFKRHADVATFLINKGADVNGRDASGMRKTPLHFAAHFGSAALVELLIAKGADVNAREMGGWRPLHNVTSDNNPDRNDQLEIARLLIAKGADLGAVNYRYEQPLHLAAQRGDLDLIDLFISNGANIEARNDYASTPLITAAYNNQQDAVKLLLKRGALVNGNAQGGRSALFVAVGQGHMDMVELLLAHGADLSRRCFGMSILTMAMLANRGDMVQFFIEKGVRYSPVHIAAFLGNMDEVKSYLASGGNINAQDPSFQLTLLMCAFNGRHKEEMEFLISHGADLNLQNGEGFTVLHRAVQKQETEIVRMLLDHGADVKIRDDYGKTPLFYAIRGDYAVRASDMELMKMIIAKGADVNSRMGHQLGVYNDEDAGWTPLHVVCSTPWREDTKDRVELLIAHGADINAKSKNGVTPLAVLKRNGSLLKKGGVEELHPDLSDLVEFLREHGAKE